MVIADPAIISSGNGSYALMRLKPGADSSGRKQASQAWPEAQARVNAWLKGPDA
jgi:hypothetical protein